MKYTPKEFEKIWNSSNNITEVMEKTGFTYSTLHSAASRFRSVGFKLKSMREITNERKPTIQKSN